MEIKKYVFIVFRNEILNMCYEIEVFDSIFENEIDAKNRVKELKDAYIIKEVLKWTKINL